MPPGGRHHTTTEASERDSNDRCQGIRQQHLDTIVQTSTMQGAPSAIGATDEDCVRPRQAQSNFQHHHAPAQLAPLALGTTPKRPETQNAFSFMAHLYRPGEKVLAFDKMESKTAVEVVEIAQPMDCRVPGSIRDGGRHGLGIWYLCNPVDGLWHPNPRNENKPSCRSEESLTAFRYCVLESDQAPFAEWLAFVVQLPLRVAAIYTSGGRSIHALIRLDAANKAEFDATIAPLKRPFKILGAAPACLSAVRLTRLPGCHRPEKGGFQRLLYLCPNPPAVRMVDLPVIFPRFESLDRWRNICSRWNQNQEAFL